VFAQPSAADAAGTPDSGEGLSEIVVTAQRREENQLDVPIAIASISSAKLSDAGIASTEVLTQSIPSLQFTRSSASGLFFIRGVGTTNPASGDEGSNAFYIDNVYLPDLAQTVTSFNNIERVEVLKGPQGTLFGRNAFGGLVHIITREPGDRTVVSAEASYGNFQTAEGRLYVAGPIADDLSMDLALTGRDQGKGWGRNTTTGANIRSLDSWGARSKLVFRPSEDIKVTLAGDYFSYDDDTTTFGVDPDYIAVGLPGLPPIRSAGYLNSAANDASLTELRNWGASLKVEADLGPVSLSSISAMRDSKNDSLLDADGGPVRWLNLHLITDSRSYQQELRLASNETEPFSWQVGGFYLNSRVGNDFTLVGLATGGPNVGSRVLSSLKTNSFAAFGEATYLITPTTQLTGGLRWTRDSRRFEGDRFGFANGVTTGSLLSNADRLSYEQITYRVAIRQEITADINAYASFNRGFKAGTFTIASPETAPVQPQFINAFEVGLKAELFDRKLRVNVSAYHYDISDYQVKSASLAFAQVVLLNAAQVKVDGLDIEFEANPVRGLNLYGGLTLLDSRFAEFGPIPGVSQGAPFIYPNPATCNAPGTAQPGRTTGSQTGGFLTCFGDASGNQTPIAPDFTASVGGTYSLPVNETGEIRLTALYSYNSGFPFEPDGLLRQDSYSLLNASVEYRPDRHWGIKLWGRNITDTEYFSARIGTGLGGAVTPSAPRTYGLTVSYDY